MIQKRTDISSFLSCKKIAMVGVSRDEKDFSRRLYQAMEKTGYSMIPVNNEAETIGEKRCFSKVTEIDPSPEGALIMLPKENAREAVLDCIDAGVKRVWVYGISGPKDVDPSVLELSEKEDILLIAGYCPFMFLEGSSFIHKLHGTIWKIAGLYPK